MNKKAVIYCRVSSKEQLQNNSLPLQEKLCREYCEREGLEVDLVFLEKGESAKTTDRTELKKLLAYCEKNKKKIFAVVFNDLSRFSRDTADYLGLKAVLGRLGIKLRSNSFKIEETPESLLLETITASLGQYDNNKKAERTIAGMKEAATLGRWNHKPPFGYISGLDALGKKTILINKKVAPLIKTAFEEFSAGGQTKQEVLNDLSEKGLREPNGKKVSPQHFDKILRNPLYAGWNVEKKWEIKERGNWEPIISAETFDKVQEILNRKTPLSTRKKINFDFPLRGYALCFHCGLPLTASWSKGKNKNKKFGYYYCQNKTCRKTSIRKEEAESMFKRSMKRIKLQPEALKRLATWLNNQFKKTQEENNTLREHLNFQINQLKMQKQRYVEARFVEQTMDDSTYQEQIKTIGQAIAQKEVELESRKPPREGPLTIANLMDGGEIDIVRLFNQINLHSLEHLDIPWNMGGIVEKQRIQKLLWPNGVKIEKGNYRTPETPDILKLLSQFNGSKPKMVAPRGIEPRSNG